MDRAVENNLLATAPKAKSKPEAKAKPEPKLKPEPKVKPEPNVKPEPKVRSEPKIKPEPKVKKEPTLKRASPVKKEAAVKEEHDDYIDRSLDKEAPQQRNVTGVYNLTCAQLEEQLPDCAGNLRMLLCVDNDDIWGGFQLAMKSGVIRIDHFELDEQITFGWRAKDDWEGGRLRFGKGCFGDIGIYDRGRIRGTFYNLFNEPMEFEGQRRPGPLWCGRSAYSFNQEWDGYVSQAYGR